ncbi:hypothetical protein JQ543_21155 [Bradyrhizobium diazoefficiens]|nr:hypothetical protein [Bradyrhizobium diazoefficiens]MBR0850268.1 hypothetical protein [Bradyrhizobium diazoefficiens]
MIHLKMLLSAAAITILSINVAHSMTGGTWYDDCVKWVHSKKSEIAALPIERRLAYRQCQIEAFHVWCEQEWDGDANKVEERLEAQGLTRAQINKQFEEAVGAFCPNFLNMPFGGPPALAAIELEKVGGPGVVERWLPAAQMLKRVFQEKFPKCSTQRKTVGFVADVKACIEAGVKNIE